MSQFLNRFHKILNIHHFHSFFQNSWGHKHSHKGQLQSYMIDLFDKFHKNLHIHLNHNFFLNSWVYKYKLH